MMDRYTKIVLTVIAGSLLLLNLQLMRNVDFINNAYAQTGGVQKIALCEKTGQVCTRVVAYGDNCTNCGGPGVATKFAGE